MRFPKRLFAPALVASAALALPALPALAQDADPAADPAAEPAPPPGGLEEIVVTAQRREEKLQEVPISITALTETDLELAGVRDLADIGFLVPNLRLQRAPSFDSAIQATIRGQTQDTLLLDRDPSVGLYIDDIYIPRSRGVLTTLFDTGRVEVLKGPQGTLFGRNTTGGAIRIVTNKPTDELSARIGTEFGDYAYNRLYGYANVPISDWLAVRLSFDAANRDGFTHVDEQPDLDDLRQEGYRASIRFTPTERVISDFSFDYANVHNNGGGNILRSVRVPSTANTLSGGLMVQELAQGGKQDGSRDTFSDLALFSDVDHYGISNTTSVEFDQFTVKNIFSYRSLESEQNFNLDGSAARILELDQLSQNLHYLQEEFQVYGTALDGKLDWITGLFYFNERGADDTASIILGALGGFGVGTDTKGDAENTSYSAYAQGTYHFDDFVPGLSFTGGLRWTEDKREVRASARARNAAMTCRLTDANLMPWPGCERTEEKSFSEPTWTAVLQYQATDQMMLYLAHRRGYRNGGFNIRAQSDVQFTPYDEEKVSDIEVGIKSDWILPGEMPLRFNAAGFWADYEDIQRSVRVSPPPGAPGGATIQDLILNAASAEIWGAEVELLFLPHPDLQLSFSGSFLDAEYDSFVQDADPATGMMEEDLSDNDFAFAPKWMFNTSIRYTLPLRQIGDLQIGTMVFQADHSWQSKTQLRTLNTPLSYQGKYGITNLRFQVDEVLGTGATVYFFARNVFDRAHWVSMTDLVSSLGFAAGFLGQPRTVGVGVAYQF